MRTTSFVILAGLIAVGPVPARAQEAGSARAARELVTLLQERGVDAAAAEHPDAPGTFSAVLHLPGVQLLAITTTHPVPDQVRRLIASGDHRQAYVELQIGGVRDGRVFVQDLRANGLRPDVRNGDPFDIVSHDAQRDIAYDGDWRKQQMSEAKYRDAFADDERRYTTLLEVVTARVRQPAAADPPARQVATEGR